MDTNAVETIIREKLKAALEAEKRNIASQLLTPPKLTSQAPVEGVNEAFSPVGRPQSHAPSDGAGEKRQRAQIKVLKTKQKLADLQKQAGKSHDARGMNAKLQIARTEVALAQQKLANIR